METRAPSPENNSKEAKYAQLVSSIISPYDATLIFYQAKAQQLSIDDIQNYKPVTEEVARVILSLKAIRELKELLVKQFESLKDNETVIKVENQKKGNLKKV